MTGVPFTHAPQVGFPTRAHAVEQAADHVFAEKRDKISGNATLQDQRGAVLETATLASFAHGAAFHQHQYGVAMARWVAGEEGLPI